LIYDFFLLLIRFFGERRENGMAKSRNSLEQTRKSKNDEVFIRADKLEDKGQLKSAFRLFLAGAKAGDSSCQLNVGNYYDDGKGIRRNRAAALRWYKRAYRRGISAAAHNIGILWRNEQNPKRAFSWFMRAIRMGDDEAHLEIAKHFLKNESNPRKAIPHLRKVCQSDRVTEAGAEEAAKLLKQALRQMN
jgi:TPR repeat protein